MGLILDYIDGQTPLSQEEIDCLRISSISTREELDEFEQFNIEKAIQWTLGKKISIETLFTEKYVKELHFKMFGEVWKWAGEFRFSEKNIGIKYFNIPIELKKLLDDAKYWSLNSIYNDEEIAIRFKHRLVSIHCFANGNGRHSRLFADLIIEKIFQKSFFSWGSSNLIHANESRKSYIQAIRKADKNELKDLISFAKS
jgi:Fic-DOC domain mobile mystery protein B